MGKTERDSVGAKSTVGTLSFSKGRKMTDKKTTNLWLALEGFEEKLKKMSFVEGRCKKERRKERKGREEAAAKKTND